jgi:hypothetical protein
MSSYRCKCGHVIADRTNDLPYKASLLKDQDRVQFFNWMTETLQSYALAIESGETIQWLSDQGYDKNYLELNLSHGDVLHDVICSAYLNIKKDIYECEGCGRLNVETINNQFLSYSSDTDLNNHVLSGSADKLS